jgi:hypothetical protein
MDNKQLLSLAPQVKKLQTQLAEQQVLERHVKRQLYKTQVHPRGIASCARALPTASVCAQQTAKKNEARIADLESVGTRESRRSRG